MHNFNRRPRSEMEPRRVRAWLQCGVISDRVLPLESVLYYHAMREQYGEQFVTYSGSDHEQRNPGVSLPIARCDEHGPRWYYAASFAQWGGGGIAIGADHWNCRFDLSLVDLVDWKGKKARVEVASGPMKSYHMPIYYMHALFIDWYLFAHRVSVERLLPFVTHLGKKASQGWGAVVRWEVERWSEDWSVRGEAGRLMRAIPAEKGILLGFRPSYWLPKNQAICEVP